MAHLINAKAMRIGWEQDWCDLWFSIDQYYCEYLYSCFRIRYFLIYTYFNKATDKFGVIYSHFFVFIKYKLLSLNLYYMIHEWNYLMMDFFKNILKYYLIFLEKKNDYLFHQKNLFILLI
jgi:hypothetical protein